VHSIRRSSWSVPETYFTPGASTFRRFVSKISLRLLVVKEIPGHDVRQNAGSVSFLSVKPSISVSIALFCDCLLRTYAIIVISL
jgi:hypothetical protein